MLFHTMPSIFQRAAAALALLGAFCQPAAAAPMRAEVMHWWSTGPEAAALQTIASRYRAAGGVWIDTAIEGNDQARVVAMHRIIGGNQPAAVHFNTGGQFSDLIDEDLLETVDDTARARRWDAILPEPVRKMIKVDGHYYAVPVGLHMPTWLWYSKAAFDKAGIRKAPSSMAELFAALDKLKAAGLVPLAHGDQPWQLNIIFLSVLAGTVERDLYMHVYRDRDLSAVRSAGFRQALESFRRLRKYTDGRAHDRRWNDATAMMLRGEAGMQFMGDWVKAEIVLAGQEPGKQIGCIPTFGARGPLVIQGDAFIFPKSDRPEVQRAQKLLANVMADPETQAAFGRIKGSVPLYGYPPGASMDRCTAAAVELMKEKERHVGSGENYITSKQNAALTEVLARLWSGAMTVEAAEQGIVAALEH
jgi:glucose/mannose transport system substrate-binding protein